MRLQIVTFLRAFPLILLFLVTQKVTSQTLIEIIWDRFWLAEYYPDLTVNVRLGDSINFECRENTTVGGEADLQNLIFTQNQQHVIECNATGGMAMFLYWCRATGFDHTVEITDVDFTGSGKPRFEAGVVYYFTSFSNGTMTSAEDNTTLEGGACSSQPPLRLTVSVSPTTSSVMVAAASSVVTSTTSTNTQIVASTMASTTTAAMTTSTNVLSSPTSPPQEPIVPGGAARQLLPLQFCVLLLLTIGCSIFNHI